MTISDDPGSGYEATDSTESDLGSDEDPDDEMSEFVDSFEEINWEAINKGDLTLLAWQKLRNLEDMVEAIPVEDSPGGVGLDVVCNNPAWTCTYGLETQSEIGKNPYNPQAAISFQRLVDTWSALSPEEFVQIFAALEPEQKQAQFLNVLAISLKNSQSTVTVHNREKGLTRAMKLDSPRLEILPDTHGIYTHVRRHGSELRFEIAPQFRRSKGIVGMLKNCYEDIVGTGTNKYRYAYTTAWRLFDTHDNDSFALIMKELSSASTESGVFGTVIARALVIQAWMDCEGLFYAMRIMDFVCLCLFIHIGNCVRHLVEPGPFPIYTIACLCSVNVASSLMEMYMMGKFYGCKIGLRKYLTMYKISILFVELFTFSIACRIAFVMDPDVACTSSNGCWYFEHPLFVAIMVGMKWFHFIVAMLCTDYGTYFMPAFHTFTSRPHRSFMFFLIMFVLAAFFSYYVIPIDENFDENIQLSMASAFDSRTYWKLIFTFMKIFRLTILGDFDTWEIEGVDPNIYATVPWPNGTVAGDGLMVGAVDDGKPDPNLHVGIQMWFMTVAVLINVMIMNVYIGLLSSTYDGFSPKRSQLHCKFRATFTFKELAILNIFRCFARRDDLSRDADYPGSEVGMDRCVWIAYDHKSLENENFDVMDQINELSKRLGQARDTFELKPRGPRYY